MCIFFSPFNFFSSNLPKWEPSPTINSQSGNPLAALMAMDEMPSLESEMATYHQVSTFFPFLGIPQHRFSNRIEQKKETPLFIKPEHLKSNSAKNVAAIFQNVMTLAGQIGVLYLVRHLARKSDFISSYLPTGLTAMGLVVSYVMLLADRLLMGANGSMGNYSYIKNVKFTFIASSLIQVSGLAYFIYQKVTALILITIVQQLRRPIDFLEKKTILRLNFRILCNDHASSAFQWKKRISVLSNIFSGMTNGLSAIGFLMLAPSPIMRVVNVVETAIEGCFYGRAKALFEFGNREEHDRLLAIDVMLDHVTKGRSQKQLTKHEINALKTEFHDLLTSLESDEEFQRIKADLLEQKTRVEKIKRAKESGGEYFVTVHEQWYVDLTLIKILSGAEKKEIEAAFAAKYQTEIDLSKPLNSFTTNDLIRLYRLPIFREYQETDFNLNNLKAQEEYHLLSNNRSELEKIAEWNCGRNYNVLNLEDDNIPLFALLEKARITKEANLSKMGNYLNRRIIFLSALHVATVGALYFAMPGIVTLRVIIFVAARVLFQSYSLYALSHPEEYKRVIDNEAKQKNAAIVIQQHFRAYKRGKGARKVLKVINKLHEAAKNEDHKIIMTDPEKIVQETIIKMIANQRWSQTSRNELIRSVEIFEQLIRKKFTTLVKDEVEKQEYIKQVIQAVDLKKR